MSLPDQILLKDGLVVIALVLLAYFSVPSRFKH